MDTQAVGQDIHREQGDAARDPARQAEGRGRAGIAPQLDGRDVRFRRAEAERLRPLVERDEPIQLMQEYMQPEHRRALLAKLKDDQDAQTH